MIKRQYKNILVVFGTRPEAIKMAPVIHELHKYRGIGVINVSVSQHVEMLRHVLNVFDIKVEHNLRTMSRNQTLFSISVKALEGFSRLLSRIKPDIILVQGDTTSAFMGALSAYYHKIPVAHIEAGLRTNVKYSPFPEEINRRLIGVIADFHFAPTKVAYNNLVKENVREDNIFVTGNTVIDALFETTNKGFDLRQISNNVLVRQIAEIDFKKKIVLITAHRRENFGKPFKDICQAVKVLAMNNNNIEIIYPVHLNSNVYKPAHKILGNITNIHLIRPLEYDIFVHLMRRSYLILTDSGGVQEEAPSLGKPVLVLRNVTERPEAVTAGVVKLVGTDKDKIIREAQKLIDSRSAYAKMASSLNPYGDGKAASRIVKCLLGLPFEEFGVNLRQSQTRGKRRF